jgi:aspartate kinase
MIKVMKFGGTSLGSVEAIERTASIIQRETAGKVVVVSAMSGVTNTLIDALQKRSAIGDLIGTLKERYAASARTIIGPDLYPIFEKELDLSLDDLRRALEARYMFEVDRVLDDTISSWGERLSSLTMAHILRARGLESVPLSSERAGIVAEGAPGNGSADLKKTHSNLQQSVLPLLEKGITPVVTGYYGCDAEGRPLTFGRGG